MNGLRIEYLKILPVGGTNKNSNKCKGPLFGQPLTFIMHYHTVLTHRHHLTRIKRV